ncbi:hypothetical protein Q8W71_17605 [Methylobacterium sp. NEAU 140]|uniref:hypothetical protein n=1 Tax=Methylobacterium sp. NEAU 140 TaxID=3064945 RepID=UPI0027361F39|nr:hypothetical protein [Methylobacterium sp. NEAU 140]MDP4024444.1 hypothetical protein [Methylobacterium sp. NEAU 140]
MSEVAAFEFPHEFGEPSTYRETMAALDRDAASLPDEGPIAELVAAIGSELSRCVIADRGSWECVPFLRPYGMDAARLTGSVRGMRAICQKAAGLDPRRGEMRRDMIDKSWDCISAGGYVWMA